ncbi:MAG: hypothetical protein M3Z46_07385 [Actinomycetota bacterium]|nr:hypothetical protein [Actinomycetota bacterium]
MVWIDLVLVVALIASGGSSLVAAQAPSSCRRFQFAASFAGEQQRFGDWVAKTPGGCHLARGDAYRSLALSALFALIFGIVATLALYRWWPQARGTWVLLARPLAWLPLGVGLLDICQRITVAVATARGGPSSLHLAPNALWLAPAFAWPKAIAAGVTVVLLVVTLCSHVSQRLRLHRHIVREPTLEPLDGAGAPAGEAHEAPWGLGVCCSGGGIRAGSFALGVLGVLEAPATQGDPPAPPSEASERNLAGKSILQHARFVSSVSGGGYTTGAWFNATRSPNWQAPQGPPPAEAATVPARVIGDTTAPSLSRRQYDDDPEVADGQSLFRHVQAHQQYLRTGRGGIVRSLLVAIMFLMLHLAVLGSAVALVAWPAGRVARSWYVFGGLSCGGTTDLPSAACHGTVEGDVDRTHPSSASCTNLGPGESPPLNSTLTRTRCFLRRTGVQHAPGAADVAPLIVFAGAGVVLWAISLHFPRTRTRRILRTIGSAGFALAAATAAFVIAGPFLLDVVYPVLREGPGATYGTIAGLAGVTAIVYRTLQKAITERLVVLSGYLAVAVLFVWGIYVAGNAAAREGALGLTNSWLGVDPVWRTG